MGESHTHHLLLLLVVGLQVLLLLMRSEMHPSRYFSVLLLVMFVCWWCNHIYLRKMKRSFCDAFQVILLESRDRIGGRVHTDYSFGFPVDLGASWWVPFFWTFTMCPKVHLEGMHWVFFSSFLLRRLHGVCEENPLAPIIGRLGLPLYRTSGDDSVLFDHDLER